MERDFVAELKKVINSIDKIELEDVVERPIETQPEGPLYALCQCTPSGKKSVVLLGLTFGEARQKYAFYNAKEEKYRRDLANERNERGLEYRPDSDEIVFYDTVEQEKLEQRSPYYNPKELVTENA